MRLQKFLASAQVASRRKSEELILQGLIKVNGETINKLGTIVDPEKDEIKYNNKLLKIKNTSRYILLNKPKNYLSTSSDELNRPTIFDLVPKTERLFNVGRLDKDTEGLIILTNDGDFAYRLTHPKHHIEKEYYVVVKGELLPEEKQTLESGVKIDGKKTAPCKIMLKSVKANRSELTITIHEGRKRQIRKMFENLGHPVQYLQRVRIAHIRINSLKSGQWRELTPGEIKKF